MTKAETERLQRALLAEDPGCLPRWGADGVWGRETGDALDAWVARHNSKDTGAALYNAVAGVVEGCDVSGYQKPDRCDWAAAYAAGCRFVVVKIAEGLTPTKSAATHVGSIRRQAPRMWIGGYHFARLDKAPEPQAVLAEELATEFGIRLALDLEHWLKGWGAAETIDWLQSYLGASRTAPILYVQPSFWRYRLARSSAFTGLPLWHAGSWQGEALPIASDAPIHMVPPWDCVSLWQTMGNRGRRPWYRDGKGAIDRNVFIGTEQALGDLFRTEVG